MGATWSERVLDLLPAALFTCFVAAAVHLVLILKRGRQQTANDASRPSTQAPKTPPLTTRPSTRPPQQAACSSTRLVEYVLNDSATSLARSSSQRMASAHSGDSVATLLEESACVPSPAGTATIAMQSKTCTTGPSVISIQQQINVSKAGSAAGRASLAQVSSPAATKAASLAAAGANFNMVLQRLGSAPALLRTPAQSGHPSAELHSISDVTVPKVPVLGEAAASLPPVGTASNRHVKVIPATNPATGAAEAASLATSAGIPGDAATESAAAKLPAASIDLSNIQRQLQTRAAGEEAVAVASTPLSMQRTAVPRMAPTAAAGAALPGAPAEAQAVGPSVPPAAGRTAAASRLQLPELATYPAGPAVRPVRPSALYTSPMQHITVSIKVPLPFAPDAALALQDCVSQHVISSAAAQQPPQHTIMHMVSVPGCIQLLMSVVQWREGQQPVGQAAASAAAASTPVLHAQQQEASSTPQRQLGMLGLARSESPVEGTVEAASAASVMSATSADASVTQQHITAQPYTSITTGERVVSSTLVSGPAAAVATPAPDWMVQAICRGVEQFMRMHAEASTDVPAGSRLEKKAEQVAVSAPHTDATAASSNLRSASGDSCSNSASPTDPYQSLGAPGPAFHAHQSLQRPWPGTSALIDINGQRYHLRPDPFDESAPWGLQFMEDEQAERILAEMSHPDKEAVTDIVTGQSGGTAPIAAAAAPAGGSSVVGTIYESSAAMHGSTDMAATHASAYVTAEEHRGGLMLPARQKPSHVVTLAATTALAGAGASSDVLDRTDAAWQATTTTRHVAPAPQLAAIDEQLALSLSHAVDVQQHQEQQVPASYGMAVAEAASQDVRQAESTVRAPAVPATEYSETAATQLGSATTIAVAPPTIAVQPAVPPGVWVWPLYLPATPTSSSSTACTSWMPVPVPFRPQPAAGLAAVAAPPQLPPVVAVHGLSGVSCHFVVTNTPGEVLADCPCTVQQGIARIQPEPCSAVAKRSLYCLTPHNAATGAAAGGGSSGSGTSSTRRPSSSSSTRQPLPPGNSSSTGPWQAHPRMDPAAGKVLVALPVLYLPPAVVHELNESARAVLREEAHQQLIEQQEHAAALGSGPDYIYMYASEMPSDKSSHGSIEADEYGLGSEGSSSRHLGSFDTLQAGSACASVSSARSSSSTLSACSSSTRPQRRGAGAAELPSGRRQEQQQQQRATAAQHASAAGPTAAAAGGGTSLGGGLSGSAGCTLDDDDQHMVNLRGRLFAGEDVQKLYVALLADVGLLIDLATTADLARTAAAGAAATAGDGQARVARDGSVSCADSSVGRGSSNSTGSTACSTIAYVSSASSEASKHMAATVGQQLLSWGASKSAWNFCQLVLMLLDAIGVLLQMHGQPIMRENFATAAAVQQMLLGQVGAGVPNPAAGTAANSSNAFAPFKVARASRLPGRVAGAGASSPSGYPHLPTTAAAPANVAAPPVSTLAATAAALQLPRTPASAAPAVSASAAGVSAPGSCGDNRLAADPMSLPLALQRAPTPSPHQLQMQLQMQSPGLLSEAASVPSQPLEWWDSARSAAAVATRQPTTTVRVAAGVAQQAGVVISMSAGGTVGVVATGDGTSRVDASQEGTPGVAAAKDSTGVGVAVVQAPPSAHFSAESSTHTAGSNSAIQGTIALSSGASSDVPVVQQRRLGSARSLTEHGRRFRLTLKDSASDMFSRLLRRQDKGHKPAP